MDAQRVSLNVPVDHDSPAAVARVPLSGEILVPSPEMLRVRGAGSGAGSPRSRGSDTATGPARHERGDPGGVPGYDAVDSTADEGGWVRSRGLPGVIRHRDRYSGEWNGGGAEVRRTEHALTGLRLLDGVLVLRIARGRQAGQVRLVDADAGDAARCVRSCGRYGSRRRSAGDAPRGRRRLLGPGSSSRRRRRCARRTRSCGAASYSATADTSFAMRQTTIEEDDRSVGVRCA